MINKTLLQFCILHFFFFSRRYIRFPNVSQWMDCKSLLSHFFFASYNIHCKRQWTLSRTNSFCWQNKVWAVKKMPACTNFKKVHVPRLRPTVLLLQAASSMVVTYFFDRYICQSLLKLHNMNRAGFEEDLTGESETKVLFYSINVRFHTQDLSDRHNELNRYQTRRIRR